MDSQDEKTTAEADFRLIKETSPVGSYAGMFDSLRSEHSSFRTNDLHGYWVLTGYDDVESAFLDHETFSSVSTSIVCPDPPARSWPPIMLDPPEHTRWRRLLSPLLSPRAVERYRGLITDRCTELISQLADRGSCDFVTEFANALSPYVFISIMGIPVQDLSQLLSWQTDIERPSEAPDVSVQMAQGSLNMAIYLAELVDERKAHPRDDLISYMLTWEVDGQPISADQVARVCLMLCIPGISTVDAALSYIWWQLATHEGIRRDIVSSPEIIPSAMEEFFRLYSPGMPGRKLAKDYQAGRCPMKAGETVLLPIPSANRDPKKFSDPTRFVLNRPGGNRHLAFGAGPHYCLGAHLARLETRIALEQWHKIIPEYRLAPGADVKEYRSQVFWIKSLPLVWS